MNKVLSRIILGFSVLVFLLASALTFYYFADNYNAFYKRATAEVNIPALEEGFIPQGFACVDGTENYLFSGYMHKGGPSRVYVVNDTDNSYKYVTLSIESKDYTGHLGGIATDGTNVFIASDGFLYRFSLETIMEADDKDIIVCLDFFEVNNGASFCFVDSSDNSLWVGEFYRSKNYETDTSHHFKVADDKTNHALAYKYIINNSKPYALDSTTPVLALSIPDLVQGMAITASGRIVFATSYSIPNSNIYVYGSYVGKTADAQIEINSVNVPVYFMDSENLVETINAPSMAEGIDYKDGKVYISFESASKKYYVFVRENINSVFAIEIA